jgi:hypothetical protein
VARVTVTPEAFAMVLFDADRIRTVVQNVADDTGLPVDETTPLGRARLASLDPVTISAESGSFEDARRPRQLSEAGTADVCGRLLFRVKDRLDPAFGDPPPDDEIPLAHSVTWDVYALGRLARLGYRSQRQRRLYHFRNRHGFTDAADAAFEELWTSDGLTWDRLVHLSDDANAAREPQSA